MGGRVGELSFGRRKVMTRRARRSCFGAAAALLLLSLASPALARKGTRISVADDPSLKEGSPKLVLVELSDFQCPYCGLGARDLLPKVYETYVRNGKLELMFLDLPLQMHPHAFKAAEAAACAGDQKKFWDMHHLLFSNQRALAPERLPGYAKELELDLPAFEKCLASGRHVAAIREDMRIAENLGIRGTPAYLVGRRIAGSDKVEILEVIKGLPPFETLANRLNALLSAP